LPNPEERLLINNMVQFDIVTKLVEFLHFCV